MTLRSLALGAMLLALFAACGRKGPVQAPSSPTRPPAAALTSKPVQLFYEDDGSLLSPRIEKVPLPADEAAAIRPILTALLAPASPESEPRPVPEGIEIRATYFLPDGTAIVDLGGPLFAGGWQTGSQSELMLAYSIVQTITSNLPSVRQVQFLINGQPVETLGGHVSIERPLRPNPRFVRSQPPPAQ